MFNSGGTFLYFFLDRIVMPGNYIELFISWKTYERWKSHAFIPVVYLYFTVFYRQSFRVTVKFNDIFGIKIAFTGKPAASKPVKFVSYRVLSASMSFRKILSFFLLTIPFVSLFGANVEDIFVPGNSTSYINGPTSHIWLDVSEDTSKLQYLGDGYRGVVLSSFSLKKGVSVADEDFVIALRLGDDLNLPDYDLPKLNTLASIQDVTLIEAYLEKYLELSLKAGVDYLLVPDLENIPGPKREIFERLIQMDSSFFLSESRLEVLEKAGKKQLRALLSEDKIAIVIPSLMPKLTKTLKKLERNPIAVSALTSNRKRPQHVNIPTRLITSLYQHAVSYLSHKNRTLPIQSKEIALLTTNPHGPLTTELSKYFLVRDITRQSPAEGQPIVVDARNSAELYSPFVDQYKASHPIIALVSSKTGTFIEADEYIYFEENSPLYDELIPQMLFGAIGILGRKSGEKSPYAHLQFSTIASLGKLRFANPEWEGLSSDSLQMIQKIVSEMINNRAAPGCQITVIKGGSIVYDEAFGHLTYDSLIAVKKNTIYDVASITKVLGTLLCVMSLEEKGQIILDDSIATYLPQYEDSNKGHITLRQLLAHQSGLRAYEPLWKRTLKGDFLEPFSYYTSQDEEEDRRSYGYPIHPVMMDSIRSWLIQSPLLKQEGKYKYSDLGFMVLQHVVEAVSNMSMERYLFENFYYPMGLYYTGFNPLEKGFEIYEIAPTEFDKYYRDELVWGTVHDRNAAISGGVAGHAGLFSSSKELAILMRMILNGGFYGGRRYLQPRTIDRFNQQYFTGNRRALGWDKPSRTRSNVPPQVSEQSFGHTGFTGTMVWADPEHDLVYSFVSNRIYPDSQNRKLIKANIRNRIQEVVYQSLLED